ncbi:MAG: DegV family protein [Anaerolineae bacterium]|jgi:DegV family protein with EDD domain|nr:DegV family protein [Anaerolineae bacterium]MDH7475479.1 DegV family protein [Anaerolineae bacterium]
MAKVKVVTDSTAHFEPGVAERLGIQIVPLRIHFGDEVFREGIDITSERFFRKLAESPIQPKASAPPIGEFRAVYRELNKTTDQILSIHMSSKLSHTWEVANEAASALLGRCEIAVVDSQTISLGLGILAKAAAEAANQGESLDSIIRLLRGMIPHIYVVFFVETLDYLERGGRIGKAQALLGTMLGIKPFLTIEEGEIIPMEKVQDREKAVDKLFEFVAEFSHIEQMAILQSSPEPTEETKLLIERLELTFPDLEFPILVYGPTLATHIGPNTLGVIVYEGTNEII